mgnify:CR=1 FL=1
MAWGAPLELPTAETALAGRAEKIPVPPVHFVNGQPLQPPFPAHFEQVQVALGCFWGAERRRPPCVASVPCVGRPRQRRPRQAATGRRTMDL